MRAAGGVLEFLECGFDQRFRIGARDEDGGRDLEFEAPEFAAAEDVGDGLVFFAAGDGVVEAIGRRGEENARFAHGLFDAGGGEAGGCLPQRHAPTPSSSWARRLAWSSLTRASMILSSAMPCHHLVELVERQVDAVVGAAALGEVVGADALGAVARADLILAVGRAHLVEALAFGVVDARAQDLHRLGFVLVLRFFFLHRDHDAGRASG